MIHDELPTSKRTAHPGEDPIPVPHDVWPEGDPVDDADELDVQDMVRLLDKVWPRPEGNHERVPRQFGRFSILRELGSGGFGVVYLAEDPVLKRKVALKLPRIGILSGTESWRRFLREAQAASRLDHPNLIPLLEAGTIGPVGYIVSAYVAGPSLEQWLRHQQSAASPRWAAQLVAALAHAMEHAHERGILHRDLKPANIVLYAPECAGDAASIVPGKAVTSSRGCRESATSGWPSCARQRGMKPVRESPAGRHRTWLPSRPRHGRAISRPRPTSTAWGQSCTRS